MPVDLLLGRRDGSGKGAYSAHLLRCDKFFVRLFGGGFSCILRRQDMYAVCTPITVSFCVATRLPTLTTAVRRCRGQTEFTRWSYGFSWVPSSYRACPPKGEGAFSLSLVRYNPFRRSNRHIVCPCLSIISASSSSNTHLKPLLQTLETPISGRDILAA